MKTFLERALEIAKNKNGKVLSAELPRYDSYVDLECEHGHVWKCRLSVIFSGSWCRICSDN